MFTELLRTLPTLSCTATVPPTTLAGMAIDTLRTPLATLGSSAAARTMVGTPLIVAAMGRRGTGALPTCTTAPSLPAGSVCPSPVAKIVRFDPAIAGLEEELLEPSWFAGTSAGGGDIREAVLNNPGAAGWTATAT